MRELISDFFSYLRAVIWDASNIALFVLGIISLVIGRNPDLLTIYNINDDTARTIGDGIVISSLFVANFRLYRKIHKSSQIDFSAIFQSANIKDGNTVLHNDASFRDSITLTIAFKCRISNIGTPSSFKIEFPHIWLNNPKHRSNKPIELDKNLSIKMRHMENQLRGYDDLMDLYLDSNKIKEFMMFVDIELKISQIEEFKGSISKMSPIYVQIKCIAPDKKPIYRTVECDLKVLLEAVESDFSKKMGYLRQQQNTVTIQSLSESMKRFYSGKE